LLLERVLKQISSQRPRSSEEDVERTNVSCVRLPRILKLVTVFNIMYPWSSKAVVLNFYCNLHPFVSQNIISHPLPKIVEIGHVFKTKYMFGLHILLIVKETYNTNKCIRLMKQKIILTCLYLIWIPDYLPSINIWHVSHLSESASRIPRGCVHPRLRITCIKVCDGGQPLNLKLLYLTLAVISDLKLYDLTETSSV
jgi:hypothetical protein